MRSHTSFMRRKSGRNPSSTDTLLSGTRVLTRLVQAFWIGSGANSFEVMPNTARILASVIAASGTGSMRPAAA